MINEIVEWSGCNYIINQGTTEYEPLGTAMSMHDCNGCNRNSDCTVKQKTEVWEWNKEIEKDLVRKFNEMNGF